MAGPGPLHQSTLMDNDKDQDSTAPGGFDPFALGQIMTAVMERAGPMIQDYLDKNKGDFDPRDIDPLNIQKAYGEFITALMSDPERLMKMQMDYWTQCMALWTNTLRR